MTEPAAPLKVLVVDDSAVSRKLLEHALEDQPYQAIFAKDGTEAKRLFALHSPRMVTTDWMLPDVPGPELCRHIRASSKGYTYIVILTSSSDKRDLVEGLAAGADDYLTKPFDREELLARLAVGRRTVELHAEIQAKNKQLEELARTDHLTGLPNRRAVEEFGEHQLHGALRHKYGLWVVLLDVDHFKRINDVYGHAAGDLALKCVADLLRNNTRAADISGRLGGDEFALVLSHANEQGVVQTAERMREQIARKKFSLNNQEVKITVSFGIAGLQPSGMPDFKQLLEGADRALYAAKQAGRNKVEIK
jgi:two-component system, cell cycle response regulator